MIDRYKISLVVPIYGVERYIRQFAESALGQTYDDIQFVFVNDGTKDRSMEILNELIEEKYQNLKAVHRQPFRLQSCRQGLICSSPSNP